MTGMSSRRARHGSSKNTHKNLGRKNDGLRSVVFSPLFFLLHYLKLMRLLFVEQNTEFLRHLQQLFGQMTHSSTSVVPFVVQHDAGMIGHRLPTNSILVSPFFQYDVSAITPSNCVTSLIPSGQLTLFAPANQHHTFTTMRALFQCLASMRATSPVDFVLVPPMGTYPTKAAARHIYAAFVDVFVTNKT